MNDVHKEEIGWLISPRHHMPLLSTRRAAIIISRVRLVAALFAILTPLWIIIDSWAFPAELWHQLALGRILSSGLLLTLALSWRKSTLMRDAYLALMILFLIPSAFFVYSHLLLSEFHLSGIARVVQAGYTFLPFVLVAGLSVFPLSALEGVLFAIPALLAEAMPIAVSSVSDDAVPFLAMFWLLAVIAVVTTLSGMSQLGFMISLVRQAIRDPLTGSFSRLSGEELLEIQFILSMRTNAPLSIAFFDLDNFKSINDAFGHEAGDQVLVDMTMGIRSNLRTGDMLARWGGEEFVLIMPNTFAATAGGVLARLRESGLGMRPDGSPITASIGIAERGVDSASDWRTLVDIADKRMYCAKQSGKDRVVGPEDDVAGNRRSLAA
jgi:diguanylate cyclase (GGDEF)-like protein